jgi:prolyl 4-hydroxylase
LEYLAFTYYSQGNLRRALKYTDELLKLDPEHPRAVGNKVYYEDTLKTQKDEEKRKG